MATMRHLYFYIENLGLTDPQRETLVQWFKDFNGSRSGYPNYDMQVRLRNDNQAALFESVVDRALLEVTTVKNKLAEVFGIDPSTITTVVVVSDHGEVVDFERPAGTKRLRLGVFAGRDESWSHSAEHARMYIGENANAWEVI